MNTAYVRLMLEDAARNLGALLDEMASSPDFSEIELSIHLNDVYGALNIAWNGRALSDQEAGEMRGDAYYRLRSFPLRDIIMDGK